MKSTNSYDVIVIGGGTKAERRKKRYEAQFNPYMFAFLAERLRKDRI